MLCDAHVHVGYYSRNGREEPFYYSPRRIVGVLNRCGVEEFIVSSTCAQIEGIGIADIVREAREVKCLAGRRAHIFFWLSGGLYDEDPEMRWLDSGLFEGFKFHEGETPWMQKRRKDLRRALSIAAKRRLPVMFHSDQNEWCRPSRLAELACQFPAIQFCFAHCRPMDEMAMVIAECRNVWTDTAYMALDEVPKLIDYDWHGRLMFGSDLPVWQAHENCSLTEIYRKSMQSFSTKWRLDKSNRAFSNYLSKNKRRNYDD